jgi:Dictyostelium (slime mold) repeat
LNQQRFDDLTRRLATTRSRRSVLKGVLAGAAAGIFGVSTGGAALAKGSNPYTNVANERFYILGWIFCNLERGGDKHSFCSGQCVDVETNQNNCGVCGNACAACEQCVNGQCQSICNDNNACTVDTCDHDTGKCVYTELVCDDNNVCTADRCDPLVGCIYEQISCDDNNACTADACDPETGCTNTPIDCNDGNACTVDTCDPQLGCVYSDLICDDENACTTNSCDPDVGCIYTAVDCDDGNPCTFDSCDKVVGCQYEDVEDETPCSTDEVPDGICISGVCVTPP